MSEEKTPVNPEDEFVDSPQRRNFMAALIGGASAAYAAVGGYMIYRYLSTGIADPDSNLPKEVKVEGAEGLKANSFLMFRYGSKPGIMIKNLGGELNAFSAVCTHLSCTVAYQENKERIFCACHGGVYDPKTGKNVAGPPPEPLDAYQVIKKEDGIYVKRA